jgi:hypothetical protein
MSLSLAAIAGTIAGAMLGVLVDWLLKPLLPQKPTLKHGIAGTVATATLIIVLVWTTHLVPSQAPDQPSMLEQNQLPLSEQITAAEQVRACMSQHGLSQAYTVRRREDGSTPYYLQLAQCNWPPPTYAGPDGYSEINVTQQAGPGEANVEFNMAYVISAPCSTVSVSLSFHKFNAANRFPPFIAKHSTIVDPTGDILDQSDEANRPPFFPERDDIVILTHGGTAVDEVKCILEDKSS